MFYIFSFALYFLIYHCYYNIIANSIFILSPFYFYSILLQNVTGYRAASGTQTCQACLASCEVSASGTSGMLGQETSLESNQHWCAHRGHREMYPAPLLRKGLLGKVYIIFGKIRDLWVKIVVQGPPGLRQSQTTS